MSRSLVFAVVLGAALAGCSSNKSDLSAPPDQSDHASAADTVSPPANDARFSHDRYPRRAVIETGSFGDSAGGTLVAASNEQKIDLAGVHDRGPAIIVFYRGHW